VFAVGCPRGRIGVLLLLYDGISSSLNSIAVMAMSVKLTAAITLGCDYFFGRFAPKLLAQSGEAASPPGKGHLP
jgi:hypothetical protein